MLHASRSILWSTARLRGEIIELDRDRDRGRREPTSFEMVGKGTPLINERTRSSYLDGQVEEREYAISKWSKHTWMGKIHIAFRHANTNERLHLPLGLYLVANHDIANDFHKAKALVVWPHVQQECFE